MITHLHLLPVDIFGELYVQYQYIICLKYSNWYRIDWSENLGRYWVTSNGSSSLRYLLMTLLMPLAALLVFFLLNKMIVSCMTKYVAKGLVKLMMIQFSSVAQSCLTLCNPMNHSTPGLPIHHQLPESTQTHVHGVGDAIQPSHPLSSPSPPTFNLSQHQGLFKWVSSSRQVAKILEFQLQYQSFQWTPRTDLL